VIVPAIGFDEFVEPDHPVRAIRDYVEAIDLTPAESWEGRSRTRVPTAG